MTGPGLFSVNGARISAFTLIGMLCCGLTAEASSSRMVLRAGTVVPVKLRSELNSKTSRRGDRFTAVVRYGRDDSGLPEGTRLAGVVREAVPSRRGQPGILDVDIQRAILPNGETHAIDAGLIPLNSKDIQRSSHGRLVANASKNKERLKFVGYGAGAGLVIAALTKGNVLVDTVLGAGAGYLYNEFKKQKPGDVSLKPGAEFGLRLNRDFAFKAVPSYRYSSAPIIMNDDHGSRRQDDGTRDDGNYGDRIGNRNDYSRGYSSDPMNDDDIGMMIDDKDIKFKSDKPLLLNGEVILPISVVSKAARFDYKYDSVRKEVIARNGDLRMAVGSRIARLKGERKRMRAGTEVRRGVVYVPAEFVALAVNGSCEWDSGSRTVVITTDRKE